jgi:signal transduction histidine kinase
MTASSTAVTKGKKPSSYRDYWQTLGGERFYAMARWVILILVFAVSLPKLTSPLFPLSMESDPIVFVLWLFAGYAILMSLTLFIPPMSVVLKQAYVGDLLFIVLLALFNGTSAMIFLPFYFLPLISASIRLKPLYSLAIGVITAMLYMLVVVVGSGKGIAALDLPLALQALMVAFIPWLTSSLVEHWSNNNRRSIQEADHRRIHAQNETQEYRERMHTYAAIAATLASTFDPKQVLMTTLHELEKLTPYTTALVLFSTGRPKELKIEVVEPASPSDFAKLLTIGEGSVAAMLRPSSLPRLVDDISQEPELTAVASLRACRAACIVPLRLKVTTFGLMIIASDKPGAFRQEDLDLIAGIANYLIVTLHSSQMAVDLRQMQSKLIAKEKEVRDRMASKLHDGPTQKVAQIMMQAEFIKQAMQKDPAMVPQELDKFATLAKVANDEMRMTLFELRPLTLESDGLRAALTEYVDKLKIRAGATQVHIKAKGAVDSALSKEAEGVVFDIIQESVNNALKHAKANNIWITLERKGELYTATVKDDGKGFDLNAARQSATKRASFGLKNFGERAQMIQGAVDIDSAPGAGSTVSLVIQIEQTANAE